MKNHLYRFTFAAALGLFSVGNTSAQELDWAVQYGSTGTESVTDLVLDGGDIYLAGFFSGTVDFDPGAGTTSLTSGGTTDAFILKMDSSRNLIWVKQLPNVEMAEEMKIALDASGNVLAGGKLVDLTDVDPGPGVFNLPAHPTGGSGFILKLDNNGDFVWAISLYGYEGCAVQAITTDADNNVVTAGYFKDTIDLDPGVGMFQKVSYGNEDIFIQKLDSMGQFVWAKQIGGPEEDVSGFVATDAAGSIFIAAKFQGTIDVNPNTPTTNLGSYGDFDFIVEKLDSAGNFIWYRRIGSTGSDEITGLKVSSAGMYFTGSFRDLCDFDPGSAFYDLFSAGSSDAYVCGLDLSGNFLWASQLAGAGMGQGMALALDAAGKVYVTGYFDDTTDFDPGAGVFHLSSTGGQDIFAERFDSDGNMEWARRIGSPGMTMDQSNAIAVDNAGHVYLAGAFFGNADMDPGDVSSFLIASGAQDGFLTRWNQETVGIAEPENVLEYAVYPNPTNGTLNLILDESTAGEITVMNVHGQTVHRQNFAGNKISFDVNGPAGLYFVAVTSGEKRSVIKVVKQ